MLLILKSVDSQKFAAQSSTLDTDPSDSRIHIECQHSVGESKLTAKPCMPAIFYTDFVSKLIGRDAVFNTLPNFSTIVRSGKYIVEDIEVIYDFSNVRYSDRMHIEDIIATARFGRCTKCGGEVKLSGTINSEVLANKVFLVTDPESININDSTLVSQIDSSKRPINEIGKFEFLNISREERPNSECTCSTENKLVKRMPVPELVFLRIMETFKDDTNGFSHNGNYFSVQYSSAFWPKAEFYCYRHNRKETIEAVSITGSEVDSIQNYDMAVYPTFKVDSIESAFDYLLYFTPMKSSKVARISNGMWQVTEYSDHQKGVILYSVFDNGYSNSVEINLIVKKFCNICASKADTFRNTAEECIHQNFSRGTYQYQPECCNAHLTVVAGDSFDCLSPHSLDGPAELFTVRDTGNVKYRFFLHGKNVTKEVNEHIEWPDNPYKLFNNRDIKLFLRLIEETKKE